MFSLRGTVLKLDWRNIPQSRMQSFLIINALEEFANTGVGFVEIAIFVSVHLFAFQRFINDSQAALS